MYIIKTFRDEVKIDSDEIVKLRDNMDKQLIFFRQGAVNPKQIVTVVEDVERKNDIPEIYGDSTGGKQGRIESNRSEDIFAQIRDEQGRLPEHLPSTLT